MHENFFSPQAEFRVKRQPSWRESRNHDFTRQSLPRVQDSTVATIERRYVRCKERLRSSVSSWIL